MTGPQPSYKTIGGVFHELCPSCSGCGFLTDNAAVHRQTCTTEADCPRCNGVGWLPYTKKATA